MITTRNIGHFQKDGESCTARLRQQTPRRWQLPVTMYSERNSLEAPQLK
jgi:hypothetical protein